MEKVFPAVIVLLIVFTALALMAFSWRSQKKAVSHFSTSRVPFDAVFDTAYHAMFVATTKKGHKHHRVPLPGMEFRAHGTIATGKHGILFVTRSFSEFFIPLDTISQLSLATWTLGRAVEKDGLLCVQWVPLSTSKTQSGKAHGETLSTSEAHSSQEAMSTEAEPSKDHDTEQNSQYVESFFRFRSATESQKFLETIDTNMTASKNSTAIEGDHE